MTYYIKYTIVFFTVFLFLTGVSAAAAPSVRQVSKELEFAKGIIEDGITLGKPENFARAHRVLGNLGVTIENIDDIHKRTLFTLAIGYNYVRMCPYSFLQQTGDSSALIVNCTDEAVSFFNRAITLAQQRLEKQSIADTFFLVGVGLDRLKANLNDIPGVSAEEYYWMARKNFMQAYELNTGFGGIGKMLEKYNRPKAKSEAVVSQRQFSELYRMLIFKDTRPGAKSRPTSGNGAADEPEEVIENAVVEDDTYINYKWRFSIRRPDDTWKFVVRKGRNSLQVSVRKKDETALKGSGLNVVCRTLSPSGASSALGELIAGSEKLLEQAGYKINSKQQFDFNGLQAYKIISEHKYNDLIQNGGTNSAKSGADKQLVSQQYMIITKSNGIQYIISFTGLKDEYPRLFSQYQAMANTAKFF